MDAAGQPLSLTGRPITSISNGYAFAFATNANLTTLTLSASKPALVPPSMLQPFQHPGPADQR